MISQNRDSEDGTVKGAMEDTPKCLGIDGEVKIVIGKGGEFPKTEVGKSGSV